MNKTQVLLLALAGGEFTITKKTCAPHLKGQRHMRNAPRRAAGEKQTNERKSRTTTTTKSAIKTAMEFPHFPSPPAGQRVVERTEMSSEHGPRNAPRAPRELPAKRFPPYYSPAQ
jgi:hypothetical protein